MFIDAKELSHKIKIKYRCGEVKRIVNMTITEPDLQVGSYGDDTSFLYLTVVCPKCGDKHDILLNSDE